MEANKGHTEYKKLKLHEFSVELPGILRRSLENMTKFHQENFEVVYFKISTNSNYWWFAYDVIKNMIMQIMINLPKILIWPIRPYNVSLYQILTYLDQQSYGPKKFENCLLCYMGK